MSISRRFLGLVLPICLLGVIGSAATTVSADAGEAVSANRLAASQLAVGELHACVIASKNVYCWGDNATGQLGTFDVTSSSTAIRIPGITTATAISAGFGHTCALLEDKTVWCWGTNAQNQLGYATGSSSAVPRQVLGLTNVTSIAMGSAFGCALVGSPGAVNCWGENGFAPQLGRQTTSGDPDHSPDVISALSSGVVSLAIGNRFGCAVLVDGTAKCWGENSGGQLGTRNTTSTSQVSPDPVDVVGISGITAMSSGSNHTCVVQAEGKMKCWGSPFEGQLGADIAFNDWPNFGFGQIPVDVVAGRGSASLFTDAVGVSAGSSFSCAVRSVGTVACWGLTIGTGSFGAYITAPVNVAGITTATAVSAGSNFACALEAGGQVSCWGEGGRGQLGNGSSDNSGTPVSVLGSAPQTLTFGTLADKGLGEGSFTISATTSSGAAASFASSTEAVCTVSGSTVSLVGTGTCTIVASRAASGLYGAATSVSQSFAVTGTKATVVTGSASAQSIRATLSGTVNAGGLSTAVSFVYGTDPLLKTGTTETQATTKTTTTPTEVTATVSGLSTNTVYHYRVRAVNALGTAEGAIVSFETKAPEGVTINDEAEFTNSVKVLVSVVGAATAVTALVANDGSFKTAKSFPLVEGAADIPWTLVSSRSGTFTKIVYVRFQSKFGTKLSDSTDDIILDTSKPTVNSATAALSSAAPSNVTIAAAKARAGAVKLTIRATDTVSGVGSVEMRSAAKKKSTVVKFKKAPSKVKTIGLPRTTSDSVSINTKAKKIQYRVLDRAGNASAWKWITVKK